MKKLFVLIVLLMILSSISAREWIQFDSSLEREPQVNVVESDDNRLILDIEVPGMYLQDIEENGQIYQRIELIEGRTTHDVGMPELPMITRIIGIPDDRLVKMRVLNSTTNELTGYNIYPLQTPEKDGVENNFVFVKNSKFYSSNDTYPQTNEFVDNVGIWRDVKIGGFHFIPFKYNADGNLEVTTHVRIEIEFYGFDSEHVLNKDKKLTPSFYNMYNSALINFETMGYEIDNSREITTKYLIVTNTNALNSIQPFVDYKYKEGYGVEVRTLETGFETAIQIKDYIMDLYDSDDLEYVLMVGDAYPNGSGGPDNVPMYMWSGGGGSSWSDSWYSCMGGNTDFYADIAIGRITYDNLDELDHQILKLTDFYQIPDQTTNWGENSILVAHDELYPQKYTQCKQEINDFPYSIQTPIFELCYGGAGATNTDIINWVNTTSGGIFNYRGHGSATEFWQWGPSGSFTATHVNQLTNNNRNFVLFDVCCDNMDIVGYNGDCLAESFMKADEAAIAINGAIVPSYTVPNHDYDKEMYKAIFNEGITNIGYITNYANVFVINLHGDIGIRNVLTYLWLGDSSIEPWTMQIEDLNVTHDTQLFLGTSTYDVTVMGTGGPLENARVCVSNADGTIYAVAFTNASGFAQVEFDGPVQSPGTVSVSAKAFNYLRYNSDIPVIPQTGPYCVYSANTINDAAGNNNGMLDYGESVFLTLDIENVGIEQADDVTVEIATADPYITITDNTEDYGDIAANSIVSIADGFAFDVAGDIPDGHFAMFEVAATSGTLTWDSSFSLEAHAPLLTLNGFIIDDASGNNNGRLDPGETVTISILTANEGSATSPSAIGSLTCANSLITIEDETYTIGEIAAGSSVDAIYTVTADQIIVEGTPINFGYEVVAGEYTIQTVYSIAIGLIVEDFESNNFENFEWEFSGNANWLITTGAYEGTYCAKSGTINHSQTSSVYLEADVLSDGELSFYKKVSSESNWDYLKFYVDNTMLDSWSGTIDWSLETYDISAGAHTFKWEYYKDGSVSSGSDCAWIDYIIFPPIAMGAMGTVSGVVTDIDTSLPIVGADIAGMTISGADGSYTFSIVPGTFNFTCTADNYFDLLMEDIVVVEEQTTTLDFAMQASNSPVNLMAEVANYNEVELSWDAPDEDIMSSKSNIIKSKVKQSNPVISRELIGYNVYMDSVLLEQITELSYTVLALDAGDYEFYVTSVYDEGESDPSNDANVTINLMPVENLEAASLSSDIVLTWTVPQRDLMEYKIYRDGTEIATTTEITYTDPSLQSGNYTYEVTVMYDGGYESDPVEVIIEHTDANGLVLPLTTELTGNYPNPFNPTTTISFSIIDAGKVSINIYNMKGQLVKTLVNEHLDPAYHTAVWFGRDNNNKAVSSGIYFYKMNTGKFTETKKMILMK